MWFIAKIWLHFLLDDCHFGYITKLGGMGKIMSSFNDIFKTKFVIFPTNLKNVRIYFYIFIFSIFSIHKSDDFLMVKKKI
jgi:hypothetical protein